MRVGWVAGAVVLLALAVALWSSRGSSSPVAPRTAQPEAIVQQGSPHDPARELPEDLETESRTTVESEPAPAVRPAREERDEETIEPARLSLLVLDVDGRPWPHGRLGLTQSLQGSQVIRSSRLRSEREVREPIGDLVSSQWRSANLGPVVILMGQTELRTDSEGRAALVIRPGGSFAVVALDEAGGVGGRYEDNSFAPGEVREVTLRLERRAWTLAGRCIDPTGAALETRVQVTSGESGLETRTDAEGRFAFPPLFAERVTLTAKENGLVRQVREVELPSPPLELAFEVARVLHVTLVDPAGIPFTLHELRAYGPAGDARIDTYPAVHGDVHEFDSMPWVPLELAIEGCGGRPTLAVDAETVDVVWTLERPGTVRFEWAAATQEPGWRIRFDLERLGAGGAEPVESRPIPRGQPIPDWKLFAGRYRLQVLADEPAPESELAPFGAPLEFEVRSGQPTHVLVGD